MIKGPLFDSYAAQQTDILARSPPIEPDTHPTVIQHDTLQVNTVVAMATSTTRLTENEAMTTKAKKRRCQTIAVIPIASSGFNVIEKGLTD